MSERVLKQVTIHTDGGCQGNPGPGGWAALLRWNSQARELAGGEPATTNNRMELQAAIAALTALKEPCAVTLYTDSEYLRQGITGWLKHWKRNRWLTAERKPVKNEDLWRALDEVVSRHQVTWHWCKGHAGNKDNERCDQLATMEIEKIRRAYTKQALANLRDTFMKGRDLDKSQQVLLS